MRGSVLETARLLDQPIIKHLDNYLYLFLKLFLLFKVRDFGISPCIRICGRDSRERGWGFGVGFVELFVRCREDFVVV